MILLDHNPGSVEGYLSVNLELWFTLLGFSMLPLIFPIFPGVDELLIEEGDHYLFWYKKL